MSEVATSAAICSVPDCEAPAKARGWCSTHYGQFLKEGLFRTARQDNPTLNFGSLSMLPRYPKWVSDALYEIAETVETEEEFQSRKLAVLKKWLQPKKVRR